MDGVGGHRIMDEINQTQKRQIQCSHSYVEAKKKKKRVENNYQGRVIEGWAPLCPPTKRE